MFKDLEMMEAQDSLEQPAFGEDPESAVLEDSADIAEAAALTEQEAAVLDECAEISAQQALEQYALDDEGVLAALEAHAAATETKPDDGKRLTVEHGRPCDRGCSGSSWCVGCGDLK